MGPLRVFIGSSALSTFGSFLSQIALNLFAFKATGSALVTGLFIGVRLISALATAPLAGQLTTHGNRRAAIVGGDGIQAAGLVALTLLSEASSGVIVPLLLGLALISGTAGTVSSVARQASLPVMAGERAVQALGSLVTTRSVAQVLGFASAGVIVSALGYRAAFLTDAATFVVAAAVVAWLPLSLNEPREHDDANEATTDGRPQGWRRLTSVGIERLAAGVLVLLSIRALDAFGSGSHTLALPVFFSESEPTDSARFYGGFWASWAIGGALAYALTRALKARRSEEDETRLFVVGTCAMSSLFILAFAGSPFVVLLVIALLAGIADGVTEISYTTRLQSLPDKDRGSAFALSVMVENGGLGAGILVTALLLPLLGTLPSVALLHAFPIVAGLTFLARTRRRRTSPVA